MTAETIHTCSYSCDRPECIRAQRDYLRDRLEALTAAQQQGLKVVEPVRNQAPPGSREAEMVVLETDDEGTPTIWCDPEIADLVRALNVGGMRTVASCSGHGERLGSIALADGRALVICSSPDEAIAVIRSHEGQKPAAVDGAVVEAVARAICVACEENPDHQGDARGNEFRWQDYRNPALAAISALAAQQQGGAA